MKDVTIDVAEEHSDNGARRVKLHLAFVSDLPSAGCKYNVRESDCSKDVNVRIAMAKRKKCELTTLWKDRSAAHQRPIVTLSSGPLMATAVGP